MTTEINEGNYKFKNGDSVRIMASGITGKVIAHRSDRDDNVTTLVQWKDRTNLVHEQWCRETELGSPSATDSEKEQEKATGVSTDVRESRNEQAPAHATDRPDRPDRPDQKTDRLDRTDVRKVG